LGEEGRWREDGVRDGVPLWPKMAVVTVEGELGSSEMVRERRVADDDAMSEEGALIIVRPSPADSLMDGLRDMLGDSGSSPPAVVAFDELLAVLVLSRLPGSPPWLSARLALAMASASRAYSTS
jgi:hypothetical protein